MPLLCQGMDDSIGIAPAKERKTETDYKLCIICEQKKTTEDLVANPRLDSIENVLSLSRERLEYGDTDVTGFVQRTINETAAIITECNGSYHRSCYKEFANKSKLERVINRYEKAVHNKNPSLSQYKVGRPSLGPISSPVNESDNSRTLRSSAGKFDKTMCIFCQKPGGKLNEVQYIATGKLMLSVAKTHDDDSVFRRLNSIAASADCVASDTKYHLRCWVDMKRHAKQIDNSIETQEIEDSRYVTADIEIINIIKQELGDPSHKILTIANVENMYREMLLELGVKEKDLHKSYRKYLKQLIIANIPGVSFNKSPRKFEPDRICSESAEDHAIEMALQQSEAENFKELYNAAKIIRTELEKNNKWKFSGSFSDFTAPTQLSTLIRWIVFGPKCGTENMPEKNFIKKISDTVTRVVMQNFMSKRQVNYEPKSLHERDSMYSKCETPLNVGVGLYLNQTTRSKKLIDVLWP